MSASLQRDDPKVLAFLEGACRGIRSRKLKRQLREELLSHLTASFESKLADGLEPSQALSLALEAMGAPAELARGFRAAHRPAYLKWPFLASIATCALLIAALYLMELSHRRVQELSQWAEASVARHSARFLEDQKILSALPFFDFPGRGHDAGALLNSRIAWEDSGHLLASALPGAPATWPAVPRDTWRHWGKQWVDHAREIDWSGVDFAWMAALKSYDHWDLFEKGPMHDYLSAPGRKVGPWAIPIPAYGLLQSWGKARLMKGLATGRLLPALRETRQLARLMYSTEILVGAVIAVNLLQDEKLAYERGVSQGLIRPDEWEPLSDENYVRAKRAVFAAGGFLSPWADLDLAHAAFDGKQVRAGVCAGLFEAVTPALLARLHLKTPLPFEPDFSARFETLDGIFERLSRHCRASGRGLGIDAWRNPEQSLAIRSLDHGKLIRLPFVDRWLLYPLLDAVANLIDGPYERFRLPGEALD